MTRFLLLELEAPLLSFGDVTVDALRPTARHPGASLLTGLLGNALGMHHRDTSALQRLQDRLVFGVRCMRTGHRLVDYQTVDLGQDHLVDAGWTTWGRVEGRGGAFSRGTHIREREYLSDASYLVALRLEPDDEAPTLDRLHQALERPARPLYVGRKGCLPSGRLSRGFVEGAGLREVLLAAEPVGRAELWLPAEDDAVDGHTSWVADRRDWANQIHAGRRLVRHEVVEESNA